MSSWYLIKLVDIIHTMLWFKKRPKESPTPRELVSPKEGIGFGKFGVLAAALVVGMGSGCGLSNCTGGKSQERETAPAWRVKKCTRPMFASWGFTQNADRNAFEALAISKMIAENAGDDPQRMRAALESFEKIIHNTYFDMKKIGLVKNYVKETGKHSPFAIDILQKMMDKDGFACTALEERFLSKLAEIINYVAAKSGGNAKGAMEVMSDISGADPSKDYIQLEKIRKINPYETLNSFIVIGERNEGENVAHVLRIFDAIIRHRSTKPESVDASLARRLCDVTDGVIRKTQKESGRALSIIKKCIGHYVGEFWSVMDCVRAISERYTEKEMFLGILEILGSRTEGKDSILTQPDSIDENRVRKLCDTVDFAVSKAGMRFRKEVLSALKERIAHITFEGEALELIRMSVEDFRGKDVVRRIRSIEMDFRFRGIGSRNVQDGKRLAVSLFGRNASIATITHFSYAVSQIGEENARKMYKDFGVQFFMRYNSGELKVLATNMDPAYNAKMPLMVIVTAKSDWNYAFSYRNYGSLLTTHKVLIAEARRKSEITRYLAKISRNHKKISVFMVGGHGGTETLNLGDGSDEQSLTLFDYDFYDGLKGYFVKNPTVILDSCLTGKDGKETYAIGRMISSWMGARVFAPTQESGEMKFDFSEDGEIIEVSSNVPVKEFWKGRTRIIQPHGFGFGYY